MSVTASVNAHHSFAMFDGDKLTKIEGTIYSVEWKNPHAWIWIAVPNAKGGTDVWGLEGTSPGQFAQQGFTKKDFTKGDKVVVELHPLKDGRNGGQFLRMTFGDGRQVGSLETSVDIFKQKGYVK
ncbi:MAG: DUF6152 family protein [Steroidobacteraceae bacterium]